MGTLHVIATPIGNVEDLSPRARGCLESASVVFAEDTRQTKALLRQVGIEARLASLHQHNERGRIERVLEALGEGDVALVSDAGTPAINDPGGRVVAAVAEAGHSVVPVAGPSAVTAALSVSGFELGAQGAWFLGFFPRGESERRNLRAALELFEGAVVFLESPRRVVATLAQLAETMPERLVCICRELTKTHEEIVRGTLGSVTLAETRGEFTVVMAPHTAEQSQDEAALDKMITKCLEEGLSARDTASALSIALDQPRRSVYTRVVALSKH